MKTFHSVAGMLSNTKPVLPVYCIYPHIYLQTTREFVAGFPGRVLYAVKANDNPEVIALIHRGGVTHFDCASIAEIEAVLNVCPEASCYFMVPTRLRGAAREAQTRHGVRHFLVDDLSGLASLAKEIEMASCVVFARMAVHHDSAMQDLSSKFGALPEDMPALLRAVRETGAEPALAFNVGSGVTSPQAYQHALKFAARVLANLDFRIRLVDIGGGFPRPYPGFPVPPLSDFFQTIAGTKLPLARNGVMLGEPGRALAAPGLSAVVEVLLRKEQRLYLNDGMYGIFWELRFKGHKRYAVRCYRDGQPLNGETRPFTLFGPTCDSTDVLPGRVELPVNIKAGDYLEFGCIGAYSLSGRTRFNGHYSENIVAITALDAALPTL